MAPEEAATAREQHAATQRAYHARQAVLHARNKAVMIAEGYVALRVDAYDAAIHGEAIYWRATAKIGEPMHYERMAVSRAYKPKWSHYHSLYGPGDQFTTAAPHTLIFVRPT